MKTRWKRTNLICAGATACLDLVSCFWSLFWSDLCLSKEWNLCERRLALLSPTQKHINAIVCLCICASVFTDKSWNFRKVFTRCLTVRLDRDTVKHGAFRKHPKYTCRRLRVHANQATNCALSFEESQIEQSCIDHFTSRHMKCNLLCTEGHQSHCLCCYSSHTYTIAHTHTLCAALLGSVRMQLRVFLYAVSLNLASGKILP